MLIVKIVKNISNNKNLFVNLVYQQFSYLTDPKLNHNLQEIDRLINNNRDFLGILVYNDKILIGYLIGEFKNLDYNQDKRLVYYITYMYVVPKYRNKKIATLLIKKIIDICENSRVKNILLTCESDLIVFYSKFGFNKDPVYVNLDNSNHYVMSLNL
jgi:GNAT superfamily N-acetyltransferase